MIGVNIAVNAVALLGSGALTGKGAGDEGALAMGVLGALEVGTAGEGAGIAVAGVGAITVASIGRSATLRIGFRASAGAGIATGAGVGPADTTARVLKIDCAGASVAGAAGVCSALLLNAAAGVDPEFDMTDPPPSIERIMESAICAGVALSVVEGVGAGTADGVRNRLIMLTNAGV